MALEIDFVSAASHREISGNRDAFDFDAFQTSSKLPVRRQVSPNTAEYAEIRIAGGIVPRSRSGSHMIEVPGTEGSRGSDFSRRRFWSCNSNFMGSCAAR